MWVKNRTCAPPIKKPLTEEMIKYSFSRELSLSMVSVMNCIRTIWHNVKDNCEQQTWDFTSVYFIDRIWTVTVREDLWGSHITVTHLVPTLHVLEWPIFTCIFQYWYWIQDVKVGHWMDFKIEVLNSNGGKKFNFPKLDKFSLKKNFIFI